MKKTIAMLLIAAMTCSLAGCGSTNTENKTSQTSTASESTAGESQGAYYSSTDDVTMEKLIAKTVPSEIVKQHPVFKASCLYENIGDALLEGGESTSTYAKDGEIYKLSQTIKYADGYVTNVYFSNDPEDQNYYIASTGGNEVAEMSGDEIDDIFGGSLLNYNSGEASISKVEEKDGKYLVTVSKKTESGTECLDELTIDPETGDILSAVTTYESVKSEGNATCTYSFDYSENLEIDYTALTENGGTAPEGSATEATAEKADKQEAETSDEKTTAENTEASAYEKLTYNTEDINGNPMTSEDMKEAKLVLVNYWEPWCGPCVGEMPDLQKLYENYKDKGLLILGVYSSFDMQEDAEAIAKDKGITYPLIKCDENLAKFTTDYVPITYLTDGEGNVIGEPYGGSRSYEDWEAIVKENLK